MAEMKHLFVFLALLSLSSAFLYRSSEFQKKGINVKDQKF